MSALEWRPEVQSVRVDMDGDVQLYHDSRGAADDFDSGSTCATLIMTFGPYQVEVRRDVMTVEETETWGPKAAVLLRQFAADLEKLRFELGDDREY